MRQSSLVFTAPSDRHRVVEVGGGHPKLVVFQDFLQTSWANLTLIARCTARGVGSGHEIASAMYDDDSEPDVPPFTGVRISAIYRDDEHVIVSRAEYDAILADLFDFVLAHPPDPRPPAWAAFETDARTVITRTS